MLLDRDIRENLGPLPGTSPETEPVVPAPKPNPTRWILSILGAVALALWTAAIALFLHLEHTSPGQPDAAAGRIYRFSDPWHILYLTAQQHLLVRGTLIVPPAFTVLVLIVAIAAGGKLAPAEE
jgi:hypothetical protein